MGDIARISSGAPWESIFGYSRAVRAGGWLAVSGTTSFDERGLIIGRNQMYVQGRQAIANIASALERAGMSLADVVRTRVFVTDITRFDEVARAHRESFGAHPPSSTIVEVRRLVHPDMMIEIEADAFAAPLKATAGGGDAQNAAIAHGVEGSRARSQAAPAGARAKPVLKAKPAKPKTAKAAVAEAKSNKPGARRASKRR